MKSNLLRRKFERYRTRRANRTTLVIGMKCSDGVVLVADKKVYDLEEGTTTWEDKIKLPLPEYPIIVAAAGATDLFREFNRKIPIIVSEKSMEIIIKNQKALRGSGKTLEDFEIKPEKEEIVMPPHIIMPPYKYTGENFLDDCKDLIKNITEKAEGLYQLPPIQVLIALHVGEPLLFHIDCYGRESQIDGYKAIGSGQSYAKLFFQRLWDPHKSIQESIPLACLIIKLLEDLELDNFVGVGNDVPQVEAMYKDKLVHVPISREFMNSLSPRIESFDRFIREIKLDPMDD